MYTAFEKLPPRILIVDDDPLVIRLTRGVFADSDFAFLTAGNGEQALQMLGQRPSVLVLDNVLPDLDGLSVLDAARRLDPQLPVIFLTAHGTGRTAAEAMKRGAFDFLHKPFDLAMLRNQVHRALEARRIMHEPVMIATDLANSDQANSDQAAESLIGSGPLMREVFQNMDLVAAQDTPVLLQGACGTGKALVARAIFQNSARRARPFRAVRCSDFEPALLEQELFGFEAPGSDEQIGKLEQCDGGTLLLEEISQTSPEVQSKLVHLLTRGSLERGVFGRLISTDIRLICTSSQSLEPLVAQRRFRADLYEALHCCTITLPPLRRRMDDLPILVEHFLQRFAPPDRPVPSSLRVPPQVMASLIDRAWPGNLDELQSVLQQAIYENAESELLTLV